MVFADTAPRVLSHGWGHSRVLLGEAVSVGDLIGVNTTNQWVLAQAAAAAILARYVAAEDGVIGDTISVFRMGTIFAAFDATGSEIGDVVYLSDTAGETSLATGATTQVVGWVDATNIIMVNPRNPLALDASDIGNDSLDSQHYVAGSIDMEHLAADSVESSQFVDGSIDREHYAAGSVDMTAMGAGSVQSSAFVAGSVDMTAMAADSVQSSAYVDGSIDREHYGSGSVDMTALGEDSVQSSHYVDGSIDREHYGAGSVDMTALGAGSVQSSAFVAGSVDMTAMGADSVQSSAYVDGSIDREHYAAGSVDMTALGEDSVQSSAYVDGSIDREHYAAGSVDMTALGADSVQSSAYVDGSIDAAHLDPTLITGFIPLDITSLQKIIANSIPSLSEYGGLLAADSTPYLERVNAAADKALRVAWGTTATEDNAEVAFPPVPMPIDLNAAVTLSIHLLAAMSAGNNTATIDVQVWDGVGDGEMGGVTADVTGNAVAEYSRDIAAADIAGPPLGFLNIQLVPGNHTTDLLYLYAAWIEYRRG